MVASLVTASNISNGTFSATANNVAGLLDKIGRIFDIDTNFRIDKLARFDSSYLSYGKTLEEWQADLPEVTAFDPTGANALSPAYTTFRPPFYSYTIGRYKIKQSIPYGNLERAVHNAGEYVDLIARLYSRIEDTKAQYEYALKREELGELAGLCNTAMGSTSVYATSTAYNVGTVLKESALSDVRGIVFLPIAATNTDSWATLVAAGTIVPLNLSEQLAVPVDTSTGEAFIERVKALGEIAQDFSQGNSLNGNCLGVTTDLVLVVKQGVRPVLDVQTLAGAFNQERLAMGVDVIAVPDFGSATSSDVWAILLDARGMSLHRTYDATRENPNGDGDFLNIYRHFEHTPHISRNTFVHVFHS